MFHEPLQAHVVREDRRATWATGPVDPAGHVRRGWVELGEQEARL